MANNGSFCRHDWVHHWIHRMYRRAKGEHYFTVFGEYVLSLVYGFPLDGQAFRGTCSDVFSSTSLDLF